MGPKFCAPDWVVGLHNVGFDGKISLTRWGMLRYTHTHTLHVMLLVTDPKLSWDQEEVLQQQKTYRANANELCYWSCEYYSYLHITKVAGYAILRPTSTGLLLLSSIYTKIMTILTLILIGLFFLPGMFLWPFICCMNHFFLLGEEGPSSLN